MAEEYISPEGEEITPPEEVEAEMASAEPARAFRHVLAGLPDVDFTIYECPIEGCDYVAVVSQGLPDPCPIHHCQLVPARGEG